MAEMGGRLVSTVEICEILGVTRQTLFAWRKNKVPTIAPFPKAIKLGYRTLRWYEADLIEWARLSGFDWKRAKNTPEKKASEKI